MLPKLLLLTFIGLTYGLTSEFSLDLGSQLKLVFDFPDFGEFRLPTVSCELSANALANGWFTQTVYFKHKYLLDNFGMIVRAALDVDGNVVCGLVPVEGDEVMKRKERECTEQCKRDIDNTTTPSTDGGEDETTTPSGGEVTSPSTDGGEDDTTTPSGGEGTSPSTDGGEDETTTPSGGEGTSPSTDGGDSNEETTTTTGSGGEVSTPNSSDSSEGDTTSTGDSSEEITSPSTGSGEVTSPSADDSSEEDTSSSTGSGEVTSPSSGDSSEEDTSSSTGSGEVTSPSSDDSSEEDTSSSTESGEVTSPSADNSSEEDTSSSTGSGEVTSPSADDSSEEDTSSSTESGEVTSPSADDSSEEDTRTPSGGDEGITPSTGGGDGNGGGGGRCKKGFSYIREADSCYIFSNYTAQWFDAECACASLGGTLVIINDEIEQIAISGRLSHSIWIGLNDNKVEDDFEWRDGNPLEYTKWSLEGSLNSEEKNCVELSINYNYSWVAESCEEQRRFVCEEAEYVEQITTAVCPEGWTLNEETNACYYVTDMSVAWAAAKLLCSDIGGTLATFHTLDALRFMTQMVSNATESSWIGMKTDDNGRYVWNDNSSVDFTNWANGEPQSISTGIWESMTGKKKEYCTELNHTSFFWKTKDCTTAQPAICKRLPELLPRTICPEGWEFDGEGNCFKVSSSETDYETSKRLCNLSSFGAQLALPNSDQQNTFVSDFMKKKNMMKVWAGVKVDEASHLNFGFITDFFNAIFGFKDKKCIQIDETGAWSAQSCDLKGKFMCSVPKFKSHFMGKHTE